MRKTILVRRAVLNSNILLCHCCVLQIVSLHLRSSRHKGFCLFHSVGCIQNTFDNYKSYFAKASKDTASLETQTATRCRVAVGGCSACTTSLKLRSAGTA